MFVRRYTNLELRACVNVGGLWDGFPVQVNSLFASFIVSSVRAYRFHVSNDIQRHSVYNNLETYFSIKAKISKQELERQRNVYWGDGKE